MQSTLLIGLVGSVRAGKTTACDYYKREHNAITFRNSELLEQITKNLNIEMNRCNLARVGMALFDSFGRDLLAKHWIEKIQKVKSNTKLIVIDGLRFPEEVEYYRQHSNFKLVAITATDSQRHDRSKHAIDNYKDGALGTEEFMKQSHLVNESYIEDLLIDSDIIIENNMSKNDLFYKLNKFVTTCP